MKRFTKTCGSILLAASLMLGMTGIIPSRAAETTIDPTAFFTTLSEVVTASQAVDSTVPTKTDTSISLDIQLMGASVQKMDLSNMILLNPIDHVAKATLISSGKTMDVFYDTKEGSMYYYSNTDKRYELAPASTGITTTGDIFGKLDFTKLAPLVTITAGKGDKIDKDDCKEYDLHLTAEGAAMDTIKADLENLLVGSLGTITSMVGENSSIPGFDFSKFDLFDAIKATDLTFNLFVNDAKILRRMDIDGTITINYSGMDIDLKLSAINIADVVEEKASIPAEFRDKAQLAVGITLKAGGVNLTSALKGTNTVFSVTGIANKKAKSLTIPASLKQFGKTYKVSQAKDGVFKAAKKLKTLTVKDASLKKAIKKNPSKYGLSKKVKIK